MFTRKGILFFMLICLLFGNWAVTQATDSALDESAAIVREPSSASGSAMVNVQIESQSASTQSNVPVTFGHVFAEGDVPAGQTVSGRLPNGTTIPLQVDGIATHNDGSLRYGVITAILPTLAGNGRQTLEIQSTSAAAPSGEITLNELLASDFDAEIELNMGGIRYTASARDLLESGAQVTKWLDGPLATEWQVSAPVKSVSGAEHPHLTARFYVRAYQGMERVKVDVIVENNWTFVPNPRNYDYDATITVAGQQVFQQTFATPPQWESTGHNDTSSNYPHFHHARWRQIFWWGAEPQIYVRHDAAYLIDSKALPNYDLIQPAESALAGLESRWNEEKTHPMGIGLSSRYMPGTGQRADIGPLPDWAALYLLSMDPRAKEGTLGTGDLAGSWSIHYRDQATDLPVSLDHYPDLTTHSNLSNRGPLPVPRCANSNNTLCDTPYTPDTAHQPSLVYLPYLVTGDYYYLEELHFWANQNVFETTPEYRGKQKSLVNFDQVRAQGWSLRTFGQAAYITPNTHPLKSYFMDRVRYNLEWYRQEYVDNPNANQFGILIRNYVFIHNNQRGMAPWHDDFFTWSVGYLAELGFADALPLLEWKAKFPVGRMTAPGFCWIVATPYYLNMRDSVDDPLYTTFEQIYEATVPRSVFESECASQEMADEILASGYRNEQLVAGQMIGYADVPDGFPSQLQPALAVAVDQGVSGADEAWEIFINRPVQPRNYSAQPRYNILPRGAGENPTPTPTPSPTPNPSPTPPPSGAILRTNEYNVAVDGSVTVKVEADNVPSPGLGAATVSLSYDSSVIRATSCMVNAAFTGSCNTNSSGVVRFNALSTSGVQGDFDIVDIVFEAVGEANQSSTLELNVNEFEDSSGSAIGLTVEDGSVTIGQTLGDVSCDDRVTVTDALYILQYDVQLRSASQRCPLAQNTLLLANCDVNNDNRCSSTDALFVLQCDVGLSNPFCPARSASARRPNPPTERAGSATVEIGQHEVGPSSTLNVPVRASTDGLRIGAAKIQVNFEPKVVQVSACEVPLSLVGQCNFDNQTGKIVFNALSTSGVTGNVTLADITFQSGSSGTTALDVNIQTFTDTSENAITVNDVDGQISVTSSN